MNTQLRGSFRTIALALVLLATVLPVAAQQQQQLPWVVITYVKVDADKNADYQQWLKTDWRKFAEASLADGAYVATSVLALTTPFTTDSPYNYVMVTTMNKQPNLSLDTAASEARARKAGFASWAAYRDKRNALSTAVRTEWARARHRVGAWRAGDYLRVAQYKVDQDQRGAVLEMVDEMRMPIAKQRLQDGAIKAWGVTTVVFPAGEERSWDIGISATYADGAAAVSGAGQPGEALFKKAHPDKSFGAYVAAETRLSEATKLARVRIFRIVDVIGAVPVTSPTN